MEGFDARPQACYCLYVRKKLSFLVIGVVNTLVDIGIYTLLVQLDVLPMFFANFVSTSVGIGCSFYLNRRFTFKQTGSADKKSFVAFFGITAFGLWVLQPIIIAITSGVLAGKNWPVPDVLLTLVPKLIATGFTLVWNYVLYDKVVFKKKP